MLLPHDGAVKENLLVSGNGVERGDTGACYLINKNRGHLYLTLSNDVKGQCRHVRKHLFLTLKCDVIAGQRDRICAT